MLNSICKYPVRLFDISLMLENQIYECYEMCFCDLLLGRDPCSPPPESALGYYVSSLKLEEIMNYVSFSDIIWLKVLEDNCYLRIIDTKNLKNKQKNAFEKKLLSCQPKVTVT